MADAFAAIDAATGGDIFSALDGPKPPEPKPNPAVAGADLYDPGIVGTAASTVGKGVGAVGDAASAVKKAIAGNVLSNYLTSHAASTDISKIPLVGKVAAPVASVLESAAAPAAKGLETEANTLLNLHVPLKQYVFQPLAQAQKQLPVIGPNVLAPATEAIGDFAEGMATPLNTAIAAFAPELHPAVQRAIATVFAYKGGGATWQEAKAAWDSLSNADIPATAKHTVAALLDAAQTVGGTYGALNGFPEGQTPEKYAADKAAYDKAVAAQNPPMEAYSAGTGEQQIPADQTAAATGAEQGPVRPPMDLAPSPRPVGMEPGAAAAPIAPPNYFQIMPPKIVAPEGVFGRTPSAAPDPLDLVWSAKEKKLSQEELDYQTPGQILDALKAGKNLEPETIDRVMRADPVASVMAQRQAKVAQEAPIQTRQDVLDAVNEGQKLEPETIERAMGPLPKNAGFVDLGDGKGLTPVEETPDGRIIQRLSRADDDTTSLAGGVLSDHYGSADFQTIANKFAQENGTGRIKVDTKPGVVPETRAVKGGNWRILVPQDTDPVEFFHELALHVATRDGRTLLADLMPHDDTTNQMLADYLAEKGVPTLKSLDEGEGAPSYSGTAQVQGNYVQPPNLPTDTAQSPGMIARMAALAKRAPGAIADALKNPSGTLAAVRDQIPDVMPPLKALISSRVFGRAATNAARRGIEAIAPDDPGAWENFKTAKLVDNLRAKATEYMDYSKGISKLSDADVLDPKGQVPGLIDLLKNEVQGTKRFPGDFAQAAQDLLAKGNAPGLRSYLSDVYRQAAAAVPKGTDPSIFDADAFMADPKFLQMNDVFNHFIGKDLQNAFDVLHPPTQAQFPRRIGQYGYYPFVALGEDGERVNTGPSGQIGPYVAGQQSYFRSGLHDVYDTSDQALAGSTGRQWGAAQKSMALDVLQRNGWLQTVSGSVNPVETRADGSKWITVNGRAFPAGSPVQIASQQGGVRTAVMPDFLQKALGDILDPKYQGSPDNPLGRAGRILTRIQLAGIGDFVSHSVNEAATITGSIPEVGDKNSNLPTRVLRNLPGTKLANVVYQVVNGMNDPDFWTKPENTSAIMEMAKAGVLPSRFLSQGAHTGLGGFLFGEHGSDIVGRVMLWKAAREMNPGATPQQMADFTNRMGVYVPELQSAVGKWATRTGVGPFYVAGNQMLKNAVDAWTSTGKMPFASQVGPDAMQAKLVNQLNGGAIGAVAMWTAAYIASTGKPPWQDPDSKLFMLPVPDAWADTTIGRALWPYTEKAGEKHYINLAYFVNPVLARGGKLLPIEAPYNTMMRGGTAGQATSRQIANSVTQTLHPILGPGVHAATALLGFSPGMYDMTDQRGNLSPQWFSTGSKASANPAKLVGNMASGMMEGVNPTGQSIAQNVWGKYAGDRTGYEKTMAVLFHMIPVLSSVFQSSNPDLDRRGLQRQGAAIDRQEANQ